MPSRSERPPLEDAAAPDSPQPENPDEAVPARPAPDLSSLGIAGIGRRQVGMLIGAVLAVWIVAVFARQVGEASAATTRAEQVAAANQDLRGQIAAYERELALIQRQEYIVQQARGYGLGSPREIPFTLAADAPALPADAPGSASVRVGAPTDRVTPLERWLDLLFGTGE